jgi:hypothetical protein
MSGSLVYRCFHVGSHCCCYYHVDDKKVYWAVNISWNIQDAPDGFTEFYTASRTTKCSPELEPHAIIPLSCQVCGFAHSQSIPPSDQHFLAVSAGPPPQFFTEPHHPGNLFILPAPWRIRLWLKATCRSVRLTTMWFEDAKAIADQPMLLHHEGLSYDEMMEPLRTLLRLAHTEVPGDIDAHLLKFMQCLRRSPLLLEEAAVDLIFLTNTYVFNAAVLRIWDAFLLFAATSSPPLELRRHLRGFLLAVTASGHSDPSVANAALLCLIRLSCESPCRLRLNEELPQPYIRTYTRQAGAAFGVSIAEAVEADPPPRQFLVPPVVRLLARHIRAHGGLERADLFTRQVPERAKRAAVAAAARGRLDAHDVYSVAAAFRYFFEVLQTPVVPHDVFSALENPCNTAECITLALRLPNEHTDTLMFVVGLIQEAVEAVDADLAGVRNWHANVLIGRLAGVLVQTRKTGRAKDFLRSLVHAWQARKFYNEAAEPPARQRS